MAAFSRLARSTIRQTATREGLAAMKSIVLMLALLATAHAAFPADSGGSSSMSSTKDPAMERYQAAAQQSDWKSAAAAMEAAVSSSPNNADYHNLYAYSLR